MADLKIPGLNEIGFKINYCEVYKKNHYFEIDSHIHTKCEIYVNISGDISFFCNGHICSMTRGDVLIARPGDYHHCIYLSNAIHKHFWVLFDYDNNRHIWDSFLKYPFENFLRPSLKHKEEIIEICKRLNENKMSDGEKFYSFFSLLSILKNSGSVQQCSQTVDKEFMNILDYINEHICEKLTVSDISQRFFISISTVERNFMKHLGIRPAQYIRGKKLMFASELLRNGVSVSGAAEKTGFSDYSYFIEIFKSDFGMTPLKYAKSFAGIKKGEMYEEW